MNDKTNGDNNSKDKSEKKEPNSEDNSKAKEEKTDKENKSNEERTFCKPKINISNINIGALYAKVELLQKNASKLDEQVTSHAYYIYSRVHEYIKKSIELYKEQK